MERSLEHEFDAARTPGLSWEQRFWVVMALMQRDQILQFDSKRTVPAEELAERIAFYASAQAPAEPLAVAKVLRLLRSRDALDSVMLGDQFAKYSFMVQAFPDPWITFMNYGYHSPAYAKRPLRLVGAEKSWRYAAQFYHHVASQTPLAGRDVLEVGSGRGGGGAFVTRYFRPRSMTCLDGTRSNVLFSRKTHRAKQLKFVAGTAEKLGFDDASFDVVLNIESLSYYKPVEAFIAHVHRVLRPGGRFLVATYGPFEHLFAIRQKVVEHGFDVIAEEDVGDQVNDALRRFRDELPELVENNRSVRSTRACRAFMASVWNIEVKHYGCFAFERR